LQLATLAAAFAAHRCRTDKNNNYRHYYCDYLGQKARIFG